MAISSGFGSWRFNWGGGLRGRGGIAPLAISSTAYGSFAGARWARTVSAITTRLASLSITAFVSGLSGLTGAAGRSGRSSGS